MKSSKVLNAMEKAVANQYNSKDIRTSKNPRKVHLHVYDINQHIANDLKEIQRDESKPD